MATRLKAMKLREVSLVDEPASPGADIVLTKRRQTVVLFKDALGPAAADFLSIYRVETQLFDDIYKAGFDPNEARDDRGRWARAGDTLRSGLTTLATRARTVGRRLAEHAGNLAGSTRPRRVAPVTGGGLHFEFHSRTKSGRPVVSHVQIHPEHIAGHPHLERAMAAAERVLHAYGRQPEPKLASGVGGFRFKGTVGPMPGATSQPQGSGIASSLPRPNVFGTSPMSRPAQASTTPAGSSLFQPKPGINRVKDAQDRPIPLDNMTADKAGQWPYFTAKGDFVPGAAMEVQHAIERFLANPTFEDTPENTMTAEQARGARAYYTPNGDYVPKMPMHLQQRLEQRYDTELQRQIDLAEKTPRMSEAEAQAKLFAGVPITKLPPGPRPEESLFWNEANTRRPQVDRGLGKHRLFDKAFNPSESRDALGRWTAGAAGSVQTKVKATLRSLKPPHLSTLQAAASHTAAAAASFVAGQHGLPDEVASNLGQHVHSAVAAGVARVESNPHFQAFAARLGAKAKTLFRKAAALTAAEHDELKGHIATGLARTPLPAEILGSDAALAEVVRGVHDTLYRKLAGRKAAA